MYGKLEKGVLIYAPKPLIINDKAHYNPSNELYERQGYKVVNYLPCPQDEKNYKFRWVEEENKIIQVWIETEPDPQIRINELKQMLTDTDYISCKIAEGAATKEEYAEELKQRQAWREEINKLETELYGVV